MKEKTKYRNINGGIRKRDNVVRKKWMMWAILLIGVFAVLLYILADRYLIEHVEIADVRAFVGQTVSNGTAAADPSNTAGGSGTKSSGNTNNLNPAADDWNYSGRDAWISIRKITYGSGSDTVTYYAADVVLSGATVMKSAFAGNKFGTNIVEQTSVIAGENNAVFAMNGDYYGFRNDGIEIRNGVIFRNKPVRKGIAFYKNGNIKIYDETKTSGELLVKEGVWNTLSFGPALIINHSVEKELSKVRIDTNFGNKTIQGLNPRAGIGVLGKNHYLFLVVDGRSSGYSRGVTLEELAQIFQKHGCTDAYNLDGGGSATMYFNGRVVNKPLGKLKERKISDILYISNGA